MDITRALFALGGIEKEMRNYNTAISYYKQAEVHAKEVDLLTKDRELQALEVKKKIVNLDTERIKDAIPLLKELILSKTPKTKGLVEELEGAGLSGDLFDEMKSKLSKYDFKGALILLEKIGKEYSM